MHLLVAQKLQDFKTKDNKTVIVSEYYITHWIKRQTFRIDALNDIICGPKIESHYANRAYLSTTMNVGIAMTWWEDERRASRHCEKQSDEAIWFLLDRRLLQACALRLSCGFLENPPALLQASFFQEFPIGMSQPKLHKTVSTLPGRSKEK